MTSDLLIALTATFLSISLLTGVVAWYFLSRSTPGRRRLGQILEPAAPTTVLLQGPQLSAAPEPIWDALLRKLPNRGSANKRVRRLLSLAGFHQTKALAIYLTAQLVLPLLLLIPAVLLLTGTRRLIAMAAALAIGYMLPAFWISRRAGARQKEIQNGLADMLDLLVLCLEAGSSLDQALVKAGEELQVAYPALADQLRVLITEMRAGKPRLEAFRGFANRTKIDDVRALVAMLVQTDRFGTSVSQALRTHADVCRTKRRQAAEERAQKVGVKLVFPLVFCLFPALYVVMLGPAMIRFMEVFGQ